MTFYSLKEKEKPKCHELEEVTTYTQDLKSVAAYVRTESEYVKPKASEAGIPSTLVIRYLTYGNAEK